MNRAFHQHKLAIISLLLAVLMIFPLIESGLCAADYQAAQASSQSQDNTQALHDDEHSTSKSLNASNGHCEHGHCHHVTPPLSSLSAPLDLPGTYTHRSNLPKKFFSRAPEAVIKPPKA